MASASLNTGYKTIKPRAMLPRFLSFIRPYGSQRNPPINSRARLHTMAGPSEPEPKAKGVWLPVKDIHSMFSITECEATLVYQLNVRNESRRDRFILEREEEEYDQACGMYTGKIYLSTLSWTRAVDNDTEC